MDMDHDQKTPKVESLRLLPYSELKKLAKQRGIKGNLKAEKIIAALTSTDSDDTDSFSTPAAKILNSSRKKKIEKLDEDHMTPLVTPRRGTYSVESPIALKLNEATPPVEMADVTSSTINESSAFDMSNVTVGRGSERKLRSRKVSFMSPVMTPHTPKNANLKMRPKTPIVSKTSLTAVDSSPMKELQVNLGERVNTSLFTTPSKKISNESDAESSSLMIKENASAKKMQASTPKASSVMIKENASAKKMQASTPKLRKFASNKNELSKKKRLGTPNFKKIHEKAFEKMESIDDYNKRILNSAKKLGAQNLKANKITKAKSKVPAFGGTGIPFIPSVSKLGAAKWESSLSVVKSKLNEEKRKPKKSLENSKLDTKRQSKFDLRASLSRKLGYKPYTGKLKPLTPSTRLNTSSAVSEHKSKENPPKESISKAVTSNRMQSRSILKGVRTNKRFELQMKNRMSQKLE